MRRVFRSGAHSEHQRALHLPPRALQCKHSRLASALNWRLACPHLAPAWPWRLCGWGGRGGSPAVGPAPVHAGCEPWLAPSVRGAAASCKMGLHGARHCVDRRRRLRARVPLAPLCPASVVGLVQLTPNNCLDSLRCHERPLSFDMNAGPTPTPRPAPPTISANKMRADSHRERRRGRAIQNVRRPPRPALAPPRPALAHAQAAATPRTPWPGPSFSSTNCVLPWQAHRFPRRPEDLGFKKNGRVSG